MNNELSGLCYKVGIKHCLFFFNTLCILLLKVRFYDSDEVLLQNINLSCSFLCSGVTML
jgi:hypothetical protein